MYLLLAKIMFQSKKAKHIHAHTFLVLDWNLILRAEYVIVSKKLVSFKENTLLFYMGPTKTSQEGTHNIDHPWHAYLCP